MHPSHNNVLSPVRPSRDQPRITKYPSPAPQGGTTLSHDCSSRAFDKMIQERYTETNIRLQNAISRSCFPNPETEQQCSYFVKHLRIYKNLFVHTFVHLVSCCGSGLPQLMDDANIWKKWDSVQQLIHHSLIRDKLIGFLSNHPCRQHKSLCAQHFVIKDDDSDLLSHLLYCGKKPELYELSNKPAIRERAHYVKESEQVVELLWEFLVKSEDSDVVRRLRSHIYRMARKSAYLPHALRIEHPRISNEVVLAGGANGRVTKAKMNGQDVVIKKILCGDPATQKKCLEMFASEAILWKTLQHKNIVPFLGVIAEGTPDMGLVSKFCGNGNIKKYMSRCNPKDWLAWAKVWGKDLAEGLAYIHSHEPPIVHGDLKGDNVLIDDDCHARLGDFGQSHVSDSGKYLDSTRVGLAAYNPVHWMAPEIILGGERTKATDKSDIYSFGCVLYEMVSGKIPFEDHPFGDVVMSVANGKRPSRPPSISQNDRLWKIIESCWNSDPQDRPSAAQLVPFLR